MSNKNESVTVEKRSKILRTKQGLKKKAHRARRRPGALASVQPHSPRRGGGIRVVRLDLDRSHVTGAGPARSTARALCARGRGHRSNYQCPTTPTGRASERLGQAHSPVLALECTSELRLGPVPVLLPAYSIQVPARCGGSSFSDLGTHARQCVTPALHLTCQL